ncbi:hypothetical protein GCM10027034_17370 [Ramlibacter solisilvae]
MAVTVPEPHPHAAVPCLDPAAEAALFKRENDLLGANHAEEHARMREVQCEVERGERAVPAQDLGKPGPVTLQEDAAAVAAADELAAGNPDVASTAGGLAASEWALQGRWSEPFIIPVVGVTAVLLHTGKVLFWSYNPDDYYKPLSSMNGVAYVWDPATRTGHSIAPPENISCAGQTLLADGRLFIAGGNLRYPDPNAPAGTQSWKGTLTAYTFNPATEAFVRQPNMRNGRWYPTTTKLSDNRVVITSGWDQNGGEIINSDVEIFTPSASPDGVGRIDFVGQHASTGLYPLQFLLPGGTMLEAGPGRRSSYLFNPADNAWSRLPDLMGDHWVNGNGIIYTDASGPTARQVVMVAGGLDILRAPTTGNEWLDGNEPAAGWKAFPRWIQPRHNSNTVILPDGKLLTMGGNAGASPYNGPVFQAEMYSTQATETTGHWQRVVPHTIQAAYHSSAILLPDATVLLSQDDMDSSAAAAAMHKAQVYSPPYLFKGARPLIVSAPAGVTYGQSFIVTTDRQVNTAVLVAPGATTHGNDMHQRAIRLPVQVLEKATLMATVPESAAMVPPGYYMLFVLDSGGIPSVASFVRVN